jgi:hypothetical protein
MGQTVVRTVTDHFKAMVPAACGIRHFQEDAGKEGKKLLCRVDMSSGQGR